MLHNQTKEIYFMKTILVKAVRKFFMFFPSIVFILSTQTFAQPKLTITEAVKITLENNYDIRLAKNDAMISDNNYSLGNAGFLPKVDATGSLTKKINNIDQTSGGQATSIDNTGTTTVLAGIALNWTLFDGFKMFISYSRLSEYKDLGEINLRKQVEASISRLIDVFYDLVQQKYNYETAQETITISEERVRLIEDRLSVGSASRYDLLNAKVDLNADRSNLLNQELTLNNLKVSLNLLMGRNGSIDFEVDNIIDINNMLLLDQLKVTALQKNVSIIQAQKNKTISSYDTGFARGDFFPKINLNGGFNYEKDNYDTGLLSLYKSNGYNFGISLSWNIFNGFNTALSYQNALINLDKDDINLQYTKAEVESNLLIAYKSYKMNLEILKLEEENVNVAKENMELAMEQLKLGAISPIEFRETQKNYTSAQSRFSSAQYKAKLSEKNVLRESGILLQ
jgi:outer membrane protein